MVDRRGLEHLTARERECLRLVHGHLQTKEIARQLGISPLTVDSHLNRAIQKLSVSSRRDAALVLFEAEQAAGRGLHNDYGPQSSGISGEVGRLHPDTGSNRGEPPETPSNGGSRPPPDRPHRRPEGGRRPPHGMGAVVIRYALDALFVGFFFVVTTGFAIGLHLLVYWCEEIHLSPYAVNILKTMELAVLAIDGVGVVVACGFLTYRFLKALAHTE